MLFNSYDFILLFLPLTLAGFLLLARRVGHRASLIWLVIASLAYYGWWEPRNLGVLLFALAANYGIGQRLGTGTTLRRRAWLGAGVALNLALIAYYKYAGFLLANVDALFGTRFELGTILLPLGISFFTFQNIAYLVDVYRGHVQRPGALDYALFLTFFPQLIAGPIVHPREMLPQLRQPRPAGRLVLDLPIGATIFIIGLAKKVLIADPIASYATPIFTAADAGQPLTLLEGWVGMLAYSFQIYFDFSGYSDMALGLGRLFGLRLPLNFASPYKATSVIDFWRRWHMTLSRLLRDYLYIALGGNRRGKVRRYVNLMLTMLLGGLWHGASWTFVFWGGLHGLFLILNHAWRAVRGRLGLPVEAQSALGQRTGRLVTCLAVAVAWVFFRAETFGGALAVLKAAGGANGLDVGPTARILSRGVPLAWLTLLTLVVWLLPNTQEFMGRVRPACEYSYRIARNRWRSSPAAVQWTPSPAWALVGAVVFVVALARLGQISEFIYYRF